MINKIIPYTVSLFTALVTTSCVNDFDINKLPIDTAPQVAVNSIISPDRPISVILKWSKLADNTAHFKWVENAIIEIWEDDVQIIQEKTEDGNFISSYYPKHGGNYRLKVTVPEYGELYAETSVPMPPAGDIKFIKTLVYEPDNDYYQHFSISNIKLNQELRALWIEACYKYEYILDINTPLYYYPTIIEIDQINITIDGLNLAYKGSNIECEGFIRIPYDYLETTEDFSLSFIAEPYIIETIELPGMETPQAEICYIEFMAIDFIAPSEEYDRYCRSIYKQYYFRYDPDTPFLNENIVIQGNIKNGLGIFAGYGIHRSRFDGYKDYYINNFGI